VALTTKVVTANERQATLRSFHNFRPKPPMLCRTQPLDPAQASRERRRIEEHARPRAVREVRPSIPIHEIDTNDLLHQHWANARRPRSPGIQERSHQLKTVQTSYTRQSEMPCDRPVDLSAKYSRPEIRLMKRLRETEVAECGGIQYSSRNSERID
jgi:hypothetical protein